MTNRPPTFWSNSNGFWILQAWTMSLLLVCTEASSDRFCDNRPDGSFDYFYFVQQWPGAFCTRGCCFASSLPLPSVRFGIHGLWPVHFGGTGLAFVALQVIRRDSNDVIGLTVIGSSTYLRPLQNLLESVVDLANSRFAKSTASISTELDRLLQKHWVAMQCPSNPSMLYMHGWRKHGICSGMQQVYYFQTVIKLHGKYNILQTFKDAGIYPDGRSYNIAVMQEVLKKVFGADPIITCSFNQQHKASQIYEVYICLDKKRLLPFKCPDNPNLQTNCRKDDALFPAFDPRSTSPSSVSPVRLCIDPNSRNKLALRLSGDEERENWPDRELDLATCDAELGDEFQYFLGNRTGDELDVDHNILEQC